MNPVTVQRRLRRLVLGLAVLAVLWAISSRQFDDQERARYLPLHDLTAADYAEVAELLVAAEADLLTHFTFPESHRRQIRSTNPLERVNKEIKRRADVIGIFPNEAAVTRLTGAILLEIHDEWAVDTRRYLPLGSLAELDRLDDDGMTKEVEGARALLLAS